MRRALLVLAALAEAGSQLAEGDPVCFAPADSCGTTAIGMLLDASKAYTAPEAAAMRAAVADINADLNVLPHTQLVLREGLGREGEHCGCTRVRRQKFRQRHQEARRLATRRGTGDRHAARAAAN